MSAVVFEEADERFTTKQAAAFIGFSPITLHDWRRRRTGPVFYRVSRRVFYLKSDLIKFLTARRSLPE